MPDDMGTEGLAVYNCGAAYTRSGCCGCREWPRDVLGPQPRLRMHAKALFLAPIAARAMLPTAAINGAYTACMTSPGRCAVVCQACGSSEARLLAILLPSDGHL